MKQAHSAKAPACNAKKPTAKVSAMYDHQKQNGSRGVPGSEPPGARTGNRGPQKGKNEGQNSPISADVCACDDRLLTAEELAPRLGFSLRKVWEYSRKGKLPTVRFNRRDVRFHWPTVLRRLNNEGR